MEEQAYFEWIKLYTKNPDLEKISDYEQAPAIIKLAVQKMIKWQARDATIASEKIDTLSRSYFEGSAETLPNDILALLRPYMVKKAKFI